MAEVALHLEDAPSNRERTSHFVIENVHCPSCIREIEHCVEDLDGVRGARLNFTTRRLAVAYDQAVTGEVMIRDSLAAHNYDAIPYDPQALGESRDGEDRRLLWALAVAGFAAANIMIISFAVWFASDMGTATRDLLHWVSGLIALPAIAYAGQPFFRSAVGALRNRALNMDVPISLAVLLAAGMSLWDTLAGAEAIYFDAAVSLIFFLLIGRVLDHRMRRRANQAVENLIALGAREATVLDGAGARRTLPLDQIWPGMRVMVAPGQRIPVDGIVSAGSGAIDTGMIDGESLPKDIGPGGEVFAGAVNLSAELTVRVEKTEEDTLLAEIIRQMEAAEQGRAAYVRLADRAAEIYAPAVHLVAAAAFLGWWLLLGAQWGDALRIAISVLIITCPCALGLAVPAVQVVASGLLFRLGVLLKAGDGLERLAQVDTIVFDKTGTLSEGKPELINLDGLSKSDLALAATLAESSRHPLTQELARHGGGGSVELTDIQETPGMGLSARTADGEIRLGNRDWVGEAEKGQLAGSELWLRKADGSHVRFAFRDNLKADARDTVEDLQRRGYRIILASGDREAPVREAARALAITEWHAGARPTDKKALLDKLAAEGRKVLMVGDGLNDAPALSAAHVSLAFARGADIAQAAADFVYQRDHLAALPAMIAIARRARSAILQNFGLALVYNVIAIPLAVGGLVTPLIAAVAMSASSILVTANALRQRLGHGKAAPWT